MRIRAAAATSGAVVVAVCCLAAIQPAAQTPAAADAAKTAPTPEQEVLGRYCIGCHGGRRPTAGLALDVLDVASVGADAEKWEKVVRKLRARTMPPAGLPRPDEADVRSSGAARSKRRSTRQRRRTRIPGAPSCIG